MSFMPKPKQPDTPLKQVYAKKKPAKQQNTSHDDMMQDRQQMHEEDMDQMPLHKAFPPKKVK